MTRCPTRTRPKGRDNGQITVASVLAVHLIINRDGNTWIVDASPRGKFLLQYSYEGVFDRFAGLDGPPGRKTQDLPRSRAQHVPGPVRAFAEHQPERSVRATGS
jgi:hypothetical protein